MEHIHSRYRGLTKRQYKKQHGSSTPGSSKGENCQATGLDKAMLKYPRAHKTNPYDYIMCHRKKHIKANTKSFFTKNF